jgi:hypothetical protein
MLTMDSQWRPFWPVERAVSEAAGATLAEANFGASTETKPEFCWADVSADLSAGLGCAFSASIEFVSLWFPEREEL